MNEELCTKVTRLNTNVYGCRVMSSKTNSPIVEVRVDSKVKITPAFKEMLRMLDKLGYSSPMADASRSRFKGEAACNFKFIWY